MTNYTRYATVVSLAEGLRYAGRNVTYFTDIGDYPVEFDTLERLIHALMKDSSSSYGPREVLTYWESGIATAKPACGATAEQAADTIANYNRRRDALIAFLKAE